MTLEEVEETAVEEVVYLVEETAVEEVVYLVVAPRIDVESEQSPVDVTLMVAFVANVDSTDPSPV